MPRPGASGTTRAPYGSSGDTVRAQALKAGMQLLRYKERLIAFLQIYDPASLPKCDAWLADYKSDERSLFRALGERHGLTPHQALNVAALYESRQLPPPGKEPKGAPPPLRNPAAHAKPKPDLFERMVESSSASDGPAGGGPLRRQSAGASLPSAKARPVKDPHRRASAGNQARRKKSPSRKPLATLQTSSSAPKAAAAFVRGEDDVFDSEVVAASLAPESSSPPEASSSRGVTNPSPAFVVARPHPPALVDDTAAMQAAMDSRAPIRLARSHRSATQPLPLLPEHEDVTFGVEAPPLRRRASSPTDGKAAVVLAGDAAPRPQKTSRRRGRSHRNRLSSDREQPPDPALRRESKVKALRVMVEELLTERESLRNTLRRLAKFIEHRNQLTRSASNPSLAAGVPASTPPPTHSLVQASSTPPVPALPDTPLLPPGSPPPPESLTAEVAGLKAGLAAAMHHRRVLEGLVLEMAAALEAKPASSLTLVPNVASASVPADAPSPSTPSTGRVSPVVFAPPQPASMPPPGSSPAPSSAFLEARVATLEASLMFQEELASHAFENACLRAQIDAGSSSDTPLRTPERRHADLDSSVLTTDSAMTSDSVMLLSPASMPSFLTSGATSPDVAAWAERYAAPSPPASGVGDTSWLNASGTGLADLVAGPGGATPRSHTRGMAALMNSPPHGASAASTPSSSRWRASRGTPSSGSRRRRAVPPPSPKWVEDDVAHQCHHCQSSFWFLNRKHHCRRCGNVFCGDCSDNFVVLPRKKDQGPLRVCDPCMGRLSMAAESP